MRQIKPLTLLILIGLGLAACGATAQDGEGPAAGRGAPSQSLSAGDRQLLASDLAHTRRAGQGPRFRPPATTATVAAGRRVGTWRCQPRHGPAYGAHIELFALGRGIVVPAGIGVSSPVRQGPLVVGGRCLYPVHTADPTGVIHVQDLTGKAPQLGELFTLWGQRLTPNRLGVFVGRVLAYVDGRRWRGNPAGIPLRRHAQIVLELGAFVAPHPAYGFPRGL